MDRIQALQREVFENYANDLNLDPKARYLHGTPLRPVVPLDTATGGLFILGAYPSARFAVIDRNSGPSISDVPVADNLAPFEYERWFDGRRVREQPSARELRDLFLQPLGVVRSKCWITDLVKVFLFKPGHIDRYKKLGAKPPVGYTRDRFAELGERSLPWLQREIEIAQPALMITLGAEVAGVLRGKRSATAQTKLLVPEVQDLTIGDVTVPTMHCAHPGILMRKDGRNPWPRRHRDEFTRALKVEIRRAGFVT